VIPDLQVDRVHREGAEPGWVAGIEAVQPDQADTWHLILSDRPFDPFSRTGPRICRDVDGVWTDIGPVEPKADPSIHPDLKGGCADYVRIARRVLAAIPRGLCVNVELVSVRKGGGGDEVGAITTFHADGDITEGRPVHVAEEILDRIEGVRFLERTATDFGAMFGIEPYDDGSGYAGEFKLRIGKDSLLVSYQEPDAGSTIIVESEMDGEDGSWRHWTMLNATEHPTDGMDTLRRLKDDAFALASVFDDCQEDNPMSVLLGIGLDAQVPVLDLHREDDSSGSIRFMLETGRLR
jgi:hypothetical protein